MSDSEYSENYSEPEEQEESYRNNTTSDPTEGNKVYHIKNGKRILLEDGEVPENLKEPILFGKKPEEKKEKHIIDFNKPKDQMVLIDDSGAPELKEADAMLETYERGDAFDQFFGKKKKAPAPKLLGWELQYPDLCTTIRNKVDTVIPIINFSKISEINNLEKLSTVLQSFRKLNSNTVLTFSGDFMHSGAFHCTSFDGRHIIHLFNQLGVNYITLSSEDLKNFQVLERIKEFKGTVLLSNIRDSSDQKLQNTYSYVVRSITDKSDFQNNIAFFGLSNLSEDSELTQNDTKSVISNLLDSKLKNKYDLVVTLSSLSLTDNFSVSGVDLTLGTFDYNIKVIKNKHTIVASDPDLESITVSVITFPKSSKNFTLQSHVIPLINIPADPQFTHTQYWKDLGIGELKVKYNFDFGRKYKTSIAKFYTFILKALSKIEGVGYIILNSQFKNLQFPESSYDLFKLFPEDTNLVKFAISDAQLLETILGDSRIIYTEVQHSNIILTTKQIAENIITDYITDFDVTLLEDLKTVLYKNL